MKHNKKKLIILAGIACFGMAVLFSPATTLTTEAAVSSGATADPCADSISYRYKVENGKLYRRLYNYTTETWIGDWIYVGEA